MRATYADDLLSKGRWDTSSFHALSAGNTLQPSSEAPATLPPPMIGIGVGAARGADGGAGRAVAASGAALAEADGVAEADGPAPAAARPGGGAAERRAVVTALPQAVMASNPAVSATRIRAPWLNRSSGGMQP
jgi:hypothetical protein